MEELFVSAIFNLILSYLLEITRVIYTEGRWSRQYIEMQNPSDELMKVEADLSNPINFSLDVPIFSSGDQENSPLVFHVQPRSAITLPLQFIPTTLGSGNHQTKRLSCVCCCNWVKRLIRRDI